MVATMSGLERVAQVLDRKPVDRLPACEEFWGETRKRWVAGGHIGEAESLEDHFELDLRRAGWPSMVADLDFTPVVLEETAETVLKLDGNGASLRWMKNRGNAPEHVDFRVRDRSGWEEHIKPHLLSPDKRRIDREGYRNARARSAANGTFLAWAGIAPFECIHPVCGHEYMLMGMCTDPDWILDMTMTYARLIVAMLEDLFAEEGKPDGAWFYEDMGFKGRPFMSPDMYRELIMPGHKLLFDFAHSQGLKVIVHSCGFVEPLVPGLVDAGMDCLQAMEVKAGMDVHRLAGSFGDRISFMGNLDARELISNDRGRIAAEMDRVIPPLLARGRGFIVHTDHSVPSEVDYESMAYWFERGRSY